MFLGLILTIFFCCISYLNFYLGYFCLFLIGSSLGMIIDNRNTAFALKETDEIRSNFFYYFFLNGYIGIMDFIMLYLISICGARFNFKLSLLYFLLSIGFSIVIQILVRIYFYISIIFFRR